MTDTKYIRHLPTPWRACCALMVFILAGAPAMRASAQFFTVLTNFNPAANSTGSNPKAALAQGPDSTLYGTTTAGGGDASGVVFKTQPNGTGFTILWNFTGGNDGGDPEGGLLLSGGVLYGTTYSGGSNGVGTVYKVNTDGSGFAILHTFTGSSVDGANSSAALVLSGNTLYGTAYSGGNSGLGVVFAVNTNGSSYTNLYSFTGGSDCGNPYAGLTLSSGILYGATTGQSSSIAGYGSIFKINISGSGFSVLKTFLGGDGANPFGGLLLSGGNLYGTTDSGTPGYGTVFRVGTSGANFTTLYSFSGGDDGDAPYNTLVLSSGALYGSTLNGGAYNSGTLFKLSAAGGSFAVLRTFTNGVDGDSPGGGLILSGGLLYGAAYGGGTNNNGTLFSVNVSSHAFAVVSSFAAANGGFAPHGQLAISGATLYGTTSSGGSANGGTIFSMGSDGSGLRSLKSFLGLDGEFPQGGLTLLKGVLYGTTSSGGSNGYGEVFSVNTDGSDFTNLHSFNGSDGVSPYSGVIFSDGALFGTTISGGSNGYGSVFKINLDGSGFDSLYSFTQNEWSGSAYTNSDGVSPYGRLVSSGGSLYGTASSGGASGFGTVFRLNITGGGFSNLYNFTASSGYPFYTNRDGAVPQGGLVLFGDTIYGTSSSGGYGAFGTVFKMTTNGASPQFFSLTNASGAFSEGSTAELALGNDGNLYGVTEGGGVSGNGIIFQFATNGILTTFVSFDGSDGESANPLTMGNDGSFYGTTPAGGSGYGGTVFRFNPLYPSIINQPQPASRIVPAGTDVSLIAGASGGSPILLQWTINGGNLFDATNATLTLTNVNPSQSGVYVLRVTNSYGFALSSNIDLTVVPAVVSTLPASGISGDGATLNGSVMIGVDETAAWFDWGTDTNYGSVVGATNLAGGAETATLGDVLSGLNVTLTYHYRVVASNLFGIAYGSDQLFQVGLKPAAITLNVMDATKTTVTLTAAVNPEGWATTAYFQWGQSSFSLNNRTPATNLRSGIAILNLSAPVTGLTAGLPYYCQIVASNHLGVTLGATLFFNTGDWEQTLAPATHNWDSIAASSDGSILVAVAYDEAPFSSVFTAGPIYTSTNSGATWISNNAPIGPWESVACSADGSVMAAAGGGGNQILGPIYISTNSGVNWMPSGAPSNNWYSVAASADGTKLVAVDSIGRRIFRSIDSGFHWAKTGAPSNYWASVASSADGSKLVAVSGAYSYLGHPTGPIYTSTNFGSSWISNTAPLEHWQNVSCSADGNTLLAVAGGNGNIGPLYTSTNTGLTWTLRSTVGVRYWTCSACSADGTKMAAVALNTFILTSTNSGATWTANSVPSVDWNSVASSADGAFLVASVGYPATGGIYTFTSPPAPALRLQPSDGNVAIGWMIPSANLGLQQSSDLGAGNWTDVTNVPTFNFTNLHNEVILPASGEKGFFRLKQ